MAESFRATLEYFLPGEDFGRYVKRLNHVLKINKVVEDGNKTSYFVSLAGPEVYRILETLTSPTEPEDKTFDEIITLLTTHFSPKNNVISERFIFNRRYQNGNQTIADFIIELKSLSQKCEFKGFLQEALRDRLVAGILNDTIRQRLMNEKELTFVKAEEIALNHESTENQMKAFKPDMSYNAVAFNNHSDNYRSRSNVRQDDNRRRYNERSYSRDHDRNENYKRGSDSRNNQENNSYRSQSGNRRGCYICGKFNHYAKFCYFKNKENNYSKNKINPGEKRNFNSINNENDIENVNKDFLSMGLHNYII